RLARQKGEDLAEVLLIKVGGAVQHFGAFGGRGGPGFAQPQRGIHIGGAGGQHMADKGAGGGVQDFGPLRPDRPSGKKRRRLGQRLAERRAGGLDRGQIGGGGQVQPGRIAAAGEEVGRRGDGGRRDRRHFPDPCQRAGGDA